MSDIDALADTKAMRSILEKHRQAMEYADHAFQARRDGDENQAGILFRQAFECERESAELVTSENSVEPTRSVLHRSAAIGYHLQATDEVYYIIGGTGKMTINGNEFPVKPGDAMLTRGGSSHGLVQTGAGDLTIVITFQK